MDKEHQVSNCRLCLEKKKLCKSHICPEYMYKHCYDDNHSYIEFNADKKSFNKTRRKGLYEKLFCRDCENIFNRYEDYAKSVLYDEIKPMIKSTKAPYRTTDYNYTQFKLFFLSLLWRASVSTLSMFKLVNLGKYEEELRMILLMGKDTKVNNYPCLLYQTHIHHSLADAVFMQMYPAKSKVDRRTIYQFIADGLFVLIGVGVCSIKNFSSGSIISPKSLRIGYDDITKLDDFLDIYCRLDRQGKFSKYEEKHQE